MTLAEFAPTLSPGGEYPTRWSDMIGQEPAKRMLQVAIKAAKIRKQPLEHTLIAHSSPGIGKTAIAVLASQMLGTTCRTVSGALGAGGARLLFSEMNDGDVLFYDEFHQVMDGGRKNAEWLLTYLQDGTLPGPLGAEKQPRVTIIAATTDAGKLPASIAGRFLLQPPMQTYTLPEATKLTQVMARRILGEFDLPTLPKREATQLAEAGCHNPRAIKRLLTVLRDMVLTKELKPYDVLGLLEWQNITPDGLDAIAQNYLVCLAKEFGGTAGAKAIEDRLQVAGGLAGTERMLMDKLLIARTRSGRTLTQSGIARVRELLSGEVAA